MPDKVVIMTDSAEYPEEIDVNRAKAAKQRAEERMQKQLSQLEYMRSKAALSRAMARLKVTSK
jgi:F-type H+-transporting ATPase subunit epsilon